jgi:hypothetical protein
MQPLCPATNSKSSLIQMLHTCGGDALAHGIGEAAKALGTGGVDPGDGGRNHGQAEQIRQQFRKPILGQEMVVQQIDHKGADPRAILDRSRDLGCISSARIDSSDAEIFKSRPSMINAPH